MDCGISFGKILVLPLNRLYLIDGPPDLDIKPPVKPIKKLDDIPECYQKTGIIAAEALKDIQVLNVRAFLPQAYFAPTNEFNASNIVCTLFKTVKTLLKK